MSPTTATDSRRARRAGRGRGPADALLRALDRAATTRGPVPAPLRVTAQGLVLTLVMAGTTAFATLHQTVELDVDGTTTTVSGFGRTVGDLLAAEGVEVGPGDLVAPGVDEPVGDVEEIVVRHGREVVVAVDGAERTVWTTADTVEDVVAELGLREGVRAATSRSTPLGRDVLHVSTAKTVHLAVDGTTQELSTTAATVRDALAEAGVVLGEHDQVSLPLDAAVVDGLALHVTRVSVVPLTETTVDPAGQVREDDPTMLVGREVVESEGVDGRSAVSVLSFQVDGVEVSRSVLARAVLEPRVDAVVRVGTLTPPDPASSAPVEPGTARAIGRDLLLARGGDDEQWSCLDKLFTKESGWRADAHNASSGAHGIPQSLPGSKMASVGADWESNPVTQITWGLNYIEGRYGTPCAAWSHSQARNWY